MREDIIQDANLGRLEEQRMRKEHYHRNLLVYGEGSRVALTQGRLFSFLNDWATSTV